MLKCDFKKLSVDLWDWINYTEFATGFQSVCFNVTGNSDVLAKKKFSNVEYGIENEMEMEKEKEKSTFLNNFNRKLIIC